MLPTLLVDGSPLPLQTSFSISVLKPSTEFLALELCVVGIGGTGIARDVSFLLSLDATAIETRCCSVLVEAATRLGETEPEQLCWNGGGFSAWWPKNMRCFCFLSRLGENSIPRYENLIRNDDFILHPGLTKNRVPFDINHPLLWSLCRFVK